MKHTLLLLVLLFNSNSFAQVAHGGAPYEWGSASTRSPAPSVDLSALDVVAQDDASRSSSDLTNYRYGVQRMIDVDVFHDGQWDTLPDQRRICRVVIRSPGAVMLSVQFDVFHLAPNTSLYLYNEDRTFFLGGFTDENEIEGGGLATAVVPGDAIVIEFMEPSSTTAVSQLHLASITHGILDVFHFGEQGLLRDYDPGYQSAACHNNVICPIAAAWQMEKHATAMFLRPDGNGCTGQLVNNTQQPGIPYFLFANHCYQTNESQWVFYFNYESPTCVGSSGPTTQTLSGSTLKASDYYDDFALVQLSSQPPASYQPYYAGWDHSGTTPTSATAILHPLFDVKKISFDHNAPTSAISGSLHMWRCFWDSGLIESVGSGAGMYDQNHRIVGTLSNGAQTCATATSVPSGFAKLSESWDGTAPSTRLRDWLDPLNTTVALNGYDPNGTTSQMNVNAHVLLEGPYDFLSNLMSGALRASGLVPLAEPYTALGYQHHGGGGNETTAASVLALTGSLSVEDWVVIELRNKNNNTQILATRSALLLRNGAIVDVDGISAVSFSIPADNYYVAIHHRNHLGVMTAGAIPLSSTASILDFTSPSLPLYGTSPSNSVAGKLCLWGGDVTNDGTIKYTGSANDRDAILVRIGGTVPTNTVNGYYREDSNLDGVVRFTGLGNDRDIMVVNVGGTVPTNIRQAQLP